MSAVNTELLFLF